MRWRGGARSSSGRCRRDRTERTEYSRAAQRRPGGAGPLPAECHWGDDEKGVYDLAYYLVTAKPKPERRESLLGKLRNRAYESMRPFGKAMTYSLRNARLREDGYATWEEEDYCSPPLAQERAAALDEFFEELSVTSVRAGAGWAEIEVHPLLFPELARNP